MIPTLNDSLMNSLNTVPNLNNNKPNKFNQSDLDDLTDWDKFTTDKENYNTQTPSSNKMKMDLVIYEEPIALNYNNLQTSITNNLKSTDTTNTDYVQTSNEDYKFNNNESNSNNQQLGLIGLTNLGNTCYMNSGLQCLFNNKKLIYFFLNEYLKNSSKINLANNSLTSCFISLMKKVWKKTPRDYNVIKPSEFKEIMSQNYSQFQGFRQHDCQEFLSLLLGTLHDQINQGLNKTILNGELDQQKAKQATELNNEQSPLSNCCSNDLIDLSSRNSSISTSSTYCDQLSEEENDNNLQVINENHINNKTVVNCIQSYSRLIKNSSTSTSKTTISKDELNSQLQLTVKELVGKDTKLNNTNLHTDLNNQELTYDSKKFNNKTTIDNDIIVCSTNKSPLNTVDVNLLNEDYSDRFSDSTTSTNSSTNSILKRNKKRNNDKQLNNKIKEIIINDDEEYSSPKRQKTDSDHDDCSNNNLSTISNSTITNEQQFENNNLKTNDKFCSDLEWNKYLTKNKSIIVDTFQGQLKSTVKCSKCLNVSITYEPFMYLPITLPSNALERQIFVTYIPISTNACYNNDIKSARRYLLSLNKHDKLDKLINQLKNLLIKDDWGNDNTQLCIAQVEDKFIHKILDNNTLLKYVDDKFKDLYAFEMVELNFSSTYLPALTSSLSKSDWYTNDIQNFNTINNSDFIGPQLPPTDLTNDDQILQSSNDYQNTFINSTFTNNSLNNVNEIDLTSSIDNNQLPTITNTSSTTTTTNQINTDNFNFNGELFSKKFIDYNLNYLADSKLNQVNNDLENENYIPFNDMISFNDLDNKSNDSSDANNLRKNNQMQYNEQIPLANKNDDLTIVDNFDAYNLLPIQLSCAICLEEKDSEELLIHQACSCQLCCPCLDMTVKHCSENETNFLCPTCSQLISKSDFVPFFGSKKPQNFLTNYYIIPILFRIPEKRNYNNFKLVIRPILLRLPSLLSGRELYEVIDKFVPCPMPYSCVFVNKSGQKCIRCDYNSSCTGCEITRIGDVSIYPQDSIAVEFESSYSHELEQLMPDALKLIQDHHSVHDYRKPEKLTLEHCLNLFNQSEILDDDWFCTVCDSNQKAKKSLTIWKAPDTLIVYLKRFVFHDMNSIKIDEPVEYPLEKFDISPYFQVDNKFKEDNQNESLIYDLKNIICHSGSVSSGHYTAFSKHFINNKWYFFNDEEVLELNPSTSDERAYILFYQRSSNLNLDFLCDEIKK